MNKNKTLFMVQAGMIAAIYVVLTAMAAGFDLASGAIQVRFSEMLTVLPFFTPAAIPGLAIGCFLGNLFTGASIFDIIFGTLATLLGAYGTYMLRNHRLLCTFPPVIANALIIPFVLKYAYHIPGSIPVFMLTVGIGEVICCVVLGSILISAFMPLRDRLFPQTVKNQ